MQQFSLVYNNLFVFLEPVDEPRPTYDCGQLMQGSSTVQILGNDDVHVTQLVLTYRTARYAFAPNIKKALVVKNFRTSHTVCHST